METKKLVVACLVGGIIGMIIALIFKPVPGWVLVGMISGAALAYLYYDLREVIQKAPLAWERTKEEINLSCLKICGRIKNWFRAIHPVFYFFIFWFVLFCCLFLNLFIIMNTHHTHPIENFEYFLSIPIIALGLSLVLLGCWIECIINTMEKKKIFFDVRGIFEPLHEEKSQRKPIAFTYKNIYWFFMIGLTSVTFSFLRKTPFVMGKFLKFIIFWDLWLMFARFILILFRIIHSRGRMASAFYCALGIFISCLLWGRTAETPAEIAFAVIAAGIIGASIGSLACKTSKHFGLAPNK